MVGEMCVDDAGGRLLAGDPLDRLDDAQLVAHVQIAFGLVEDKHARLAYQRTRDEGHLQLPAAHLVAVARGDVGDAHPLKLVPRPLVIGVRRARQRPGLRIETHHDGIENAVGERIALRLRHVAHLRPDFAMGIFLHRPAVEQRHAGLPFQETHHAFEQRGLSHPVGTEDGKHLVFPHGKADIEKDGGLPVAERPVLDCNLHGEEAICSTKDERSRPNHPYAHRAVPRDETVLPFPFWPTDAELAARVAQKHAQTPQERSTFFRRDHLHRAYGNASRKPIFNNICVLFGSNLETRTHAYTRQAETQNQLNDTPVVHAYFEQSNRLG